MGPYCSSEREGIGVGCGHGRDPFTTPTRGVGAGLYHPRGGSMSDRIFTIALFIGMSLVALGLYAGMILWMAGTIKGVL